MSGISGIMWPVRLLVLVFVLGLLVAFAAGVKDGWDAMAGQQQVENQKAAKAPLAPKP